MNNFTLEEKERMAEILYAIGKQPINFTSVSEQTGLCRNTVSKYIAYLEAQDEVEVERNGRWRRVKLKQRAK